MAYASAQLPLFLKAHPLSRGQLFPQIPARVNIITQRFCGPRGCRRDEVWATSIPPAHPHQVGSLPHELLSRLFPDGRHCQHPAHSVPLEHAGALLPQLLQ